ncbi:MAG: transposase [Abitibacteriaceae bacterium]|nr:transposase [Abditibacteriaceae bacterium]MBV9866684.1 transposase [Abditibacteriaceae bacterium]
MREKTNSNNLGRAAAYLITYRCYGTWLHGDARGSVDRQHNVPGTALVDLDSERQCQAQRQLRHLPVNLNATCRSVLEKAIRDVCAHRNWTLHAIAVRTNHVHVVVTTNTSPELAMNSFKSWGTRALLTQRLIQPGTKLWTRHGSTRYIWKAESIEAACEYVMQGQGCNLPLQDW